MLRRKRARLALALLLATVALFPARAAGSSEQAGTYGATFLQIPVGAKAMTVPGIVAGMRPDASLMFANPATLAGLPASELYLTRANWLDDLSLNAAGLALKAPWGLRWSLGTRVLYSEALRGFNDAGQVVDEDRFYDLALTSGLSRRFVGLGVSLGMGVTYIREHLPKQTGTGVVYTLGVMYQRGDNRFEFAAKDLGGALAYPGKSYAIDSRFVVGYGRAIRMPWGGLDVGAEMTFNQSEYQRLEVGAAYVANPFLTLRTGFGHDFSAPATTQTPISAGLGIHVRRLTLDYAYVSQEYFSSTHTVSFSYAFGRGGSKTPDEPRRAQRNAVQLPNRSTAQRNMTSPTPEPAIPPAAAAPVVTDVVTQPAEPQVDKRPTESRAKPNGVDYVIVAGKHTRRSSADAEVRALRLLKIPANVSASGGHFIVVVGRYDSRKSAESALKGFRKQGHVFSIFEESR